MQDININKYDYELPKERIAEYPLEKRDQSKLLTYDEGRISDHIFSDIPTLLPQNVSLYFNNTRVLYARLPFHKPTGARIEIFCLEPYFPAEYTENLGSTGQCEWKCLIGNLKKWKSGKLQLAGYPDFGLEAELIKKNAENNIIKFTWTVNLPFAAILEKAGDVPIPPYLNRDAEEKDKYTYQTLYSRVEGSVAAPTAGLHFTDNIFKQLSIKRIPMHEVTLHVGAGTFRPVLKENVQQHEMHQEFIQVSRETISSLINNKQHIYAVGTTTVRTLESLYWIGIQIIEQMPGEEQFFFVEQWEPYHKNSKVPVKYALQAVLEYMDSYSLSQLNGHTRIIIVPGYEHKIVQGLLTNFHQPRSTLLLLLASFIGDDWYRMYQHALAGNYRFLSYGDSCLIKRT